MIELILIIVAFIGGVFFGSKESATLKADLASAQTKLFNISKELRTVETTAVNQSVKIAVADIRKHL